MGSPSKFRGMAVKLGHGVAISWDGRVVRHCTSVSHPDGMEYGRVGEVKDSHFRNHLYGTFTAAKERIVRAGRAEAATGCCLKSDASEPFEKKPRKRLNKRRRRCRKKGQLLVTSDANEEIAVVPDGESTGEFPARNRWCFANSESTGVGERTNGNEPKLSGMHVDFGLRWAMNAQLMATVGL